MEVISQAGKRGEWEIFCRGKSGWRNKKIILVAEDTFILSSSFFILDPGSIKGRRNFTEGKPLHKLKLKEVNEFA